MQLEFLYDTVKILQAVKILPAKTQTQANKLINLKSLQVIHSQIEGE